MSKAEDRALEAYPPKMRYVGIDSVKDGRKIDVNKPMRDRYVKAYQQAEKDIKEELSKLFREFMMDCINDGTDTHILHFIDVFNNKIKTIGNE